MGIILSKKDKSTKVHDINSSTSFQWNSDSSLNSYESGLQSDPILRSFDTIILDRTTSAIKSVADSPSPSLSLDSLCHVTSSLADINEQVVQYILRSKEDIWHNPELRDLVKEYFESSSKTLAFYTALKNCLQKIKNSHTFIQLAIERFNEENSDLGENKLFSKTLQELDNFKSAGDPFTVELFRNFRSVYLHQASMLLKLEAKRKKLEKKLWKLKRYRKVSTVLFGAAFAVAVICSVVVAVVTGVQVPLELVAGSSKPLQAMGKWMSSMWKEYENGVKNELDLVSPMELDTFTAKNQLGSIKELVDRWRVEIDSILFSAGIPVEPDDELAVTLAIKEIKRNLGGFKEAMDDLEININRYRKDIMRARSATLDRINKFPTRA